MFLSLVACIAGPTIIAVLARFAAGYKCTVVTGRSLGRGYLFLWAAAAVVAFVVIGILIGLCLKVNQLAPTAQTPFLKFGPPLLIAFVAVGVTVFSFHMRWLYRNRNSFFVLRNVRRAAIDQLILEVLKPYGLTAIPRRRMLLDSEWKLSSAVVKVGGLRGGPVCSVRVLGENRELREELVQKIGNALTAFAETAPPLRPLQFSLRTALAAMLLFGSAATLNWRWDPWARQFEFSHSGGITHLALSPDGQRIAGTTSQGAAYLWSLDSGEELGKLNTNTPNLFQVDFDSSGRTVMTANPTALWLWDGMTGQPLLSPFNSGNLAGRFSPDGNSLLTFASSGLAQVFKVKTGEQTAEIVHGGRWVRGVFSPDGRNVVTAGDDLLVHIWRWKDSVRDRDLEFKLDDRPKDLRFSPDGKILLAFTPSGTSYVWEYATGKCLYTFSQVNLSDAVFSPDGKYLLTLSNGGWPVWIRDTETGNSIHTLAGDGDLPKTIGWSPDGKQIIVGSQHDVEVWDAATFARTSRIPQTGLVTAAAFCADNRRIVVGASRLTLWIPRRTDGPYGVLALPELWTTILLAIAMLVSLWKDQRTEKL